MKKRFRNWYKSEKGQSIVEFAIILPIMVVLFTVPIDFFRYINTRTLLCSAASESISQIGYGSIQSGTLSSDVLQLITSTYGDRVDTGRVNVLANPVSTTKHDYTYFVYSSAKANDDPSHYWDQFEERPSSYQCADIEVQISYEMKPITFWGSLYLGDSFVVETPMYTRSVYAGGYTP